MEANYTNPPPVREHGERGSTFAKATADKTGKGEQVPHEPYVVE